MAMARDDVLKRIYVGVGFKLKEGSGPEKLVQALEPLLRRHPELIALLEFTSPGNKSRQIDCALVGPGGIDLIEVKNHHGIIHMFAEGAWTVESGDRSDYIRNEKWGRSENPYDQAFDAADDLQKGIKKKYGVSVRITPLVFLPSADARTKIVKHFNVGLALGEGALAGALRSATATKDGRWNNLDYYRLPHDLGLVPLRVSFLRGRVVDSTTHKGVEHLQVMAEVGNEQQVTRTDARGYYSFCVQLGSNVSIGYVVPQKFEEPTLVCLNADARILSIPDTKLSLRPPDKTGDEIREEVMQEMQQRVEQQARQTEAAWNNAQTQVQLVIDDLTRQLVQLQMQLNERERQLRQYQPGEGQTTLAVRVLRESQLMAIEEQSAEVASAIERLKRDDNSQQKETLNQSLALISQLTGELRQPLPSSVPQVVQIKPQERSPSEDTVTSVSANDASDSDFREAGEAATTSIPWKASPVMASHNAPKMHRAWLLVAIVLVSLLGTWGLLRPSISSQSTVPAPVDRQVEDNAPARDAETRWPTGNDNLPGEAIESVPANSSGASHLTGDPRANPSDTQSNEHLPGEPLR